MPVVGSAQEEQKPESSQASTAAASVAGQGSETKKDPQEPPKGPTAAKEGAPANGDRLVIVPASVSLESDTSQRFEARHGAGPAVVTWSVNPQFGTFKPSSDDHTVYSSPPFVFRSRTVVITATAADRSATATIEVSALRFWTHFLGAYWLAWFVASVLLIAFQWTALCPSCRTEVLISPPLVTLTPSVTQHFVSNVPVTWTTPIIAPGIYLAPTQIASEQMLNFTVASVADPKKSGSAVVVNAPDYGVSIFPAFTTVRSGESVRLTAFPTMAPGKEPPVLEFVSLTGGGQLQPDDKTANKPGPQMVTLKADPSLKRAMTITVFARTTTPPPPTPAPGGPVRMAGAHVVVLPASADAGCDAPGAECSSDAQKLLLLVSLMGAIGGIVHGIGSFGTYVGNRQLVVTWTWWYVFKPFLGALVAMLVYLVYRGGFSGTDTLASGIDCIKVGAFAGLIGLFAEPATMKLRDIFETLFTPRHDPRIDKATPAPSAPEAGKAAPTIDHLEPPTLPKDTSGESTVLVVGTGFVSGCSVKAGTKTKTTEWVSATAVRVKLEQEDLAGGNVTIVVSNPDGQSSNAVTLMVT